MSEPIRLEKRGVLIQLEIYKLVLKAYQPLFERDILLKEQISRKMGMLESHINELNCWERKQNQIEYDHSLDQANAAIQGIDDLIKQTLNQDIEVKSDRWDNAPLPCLNPRAYQKLLKL